MFGVTFASILIGTLPAIDWGTAEIFVGIIGGLVVIELAAFYVRTQINLQNSSILSGVKKLARNIIVATIVGVIPTFMFGGLYAIGLGNTLGRAMLRRVKLQDWVT